MHDMVTTAACGHQSHNNKLTRIVTREGNHSTVRWKSISVNQIPWY